MTNTVHAVIVRLCLTFDDDCSSRSANGAPVFIELPSLVIQRLLNTRSILKILNVHCKSSNDLFVNHIDLLPAFPIDSRFSEIGFKTDRDRPEDAANGTRMFIGFGPTMQLDQRGWPALLGFPFSSWSLSGIFFFNDSGNTHIRHDAEDHRVRSMPGYPAHSGSPVPWFDHLLFRFRSATPNTFSIDHSSHRGNQTAGRCANQGLQNDTPVFAHCTGGENRLLRNAARGLEHPGTWLFPSSGRNGTVDNFLLQGACCRERYDRNVLPINGLSGIINHHVF